MMKAITLFVGILSLSFSFGQQWQAVGPLGFSGSSSGHPQILFDQTGTPWLQYYDASTGEVHVETWNGSSWQTVGSGPVSPVLSPPIQTSEMAIDNSNNVYIAYRNNVSTAWKCGVKMWNGSAWIQYGPDNFSPNDATHLDIAISSTNEVYVLIADNQYRLSVMKYNGATWDSVGSTFITPTQAYASAIALDNSDTPYVCFADSTESQHLSLIKFNGTSWVYEGTPSISPAPSGQCDLIFDTNDDPVVAYKNNNNNRLYAITNTGSGWNFMGGVISDGACWQGYLKMDSNGTVHVTGRDDGNSSKAMLWKFNGADWDEVGGSQISTGLGDAPTVDFDPNDIPYVVFRDNDQSGAISAMSFCATESTVNITTCQNPFTSPSGNHTYFTSGVYKDTVSNANGCDSVININLTINSSGINVYAWSPDLCLGDSTPVFASMNGSPTFNWSNGLGTGDSVMVSPIDTTTYTVYGDDGMGCTDSIQITINVLHTTPMLTLTQSDSIICYGDSIYVEFDGGYHYSVWSPMDTTEQQWFTPTNSGTWIIYAYDSLWECWAEDSVVVELSSGPPATLAVIGNTMTITNHDPSWTYEWYLDGQLIANSDTSSYEAIVNGTYTVHIIDSLGCTSYFTTGIGGIGWNELSQELDVYPNPFMNEINFYATEFESLVIKDLSGRILYQFGSMNGPVTLDLSDLSTGTYLLQAEKNGSMITKIIMRQ